MSHVDEGQLHAWLDYGRSGMTEADYIAVGAHLARCAECASLLADERALRERAAAILGGTGPRAAQPPSFEALAERARAAGQLPISVPERPAPTPGEDARDWSERRNRRPLVGLAWAASLVAALGLGWAASTLMDREQVAIQTDSSFEQRAAETPATAASLSSESGAVGAATDQVAPEMAPPPSAGMPIGRQGLAGDATAAPPPPAIGAEQADSDPARTATAMGAATPVAGNNSSARSAPGAARVGDGGNVTITGVVRDANGQPLAGANVSLPGTRFGTTTRQNGAYELTVPATAVGTEPTLEVTTLGYSSVETALSVQGEVAFQDFRLMPAALALEELVAVGYNQQSRAMVGGLVESVTAEASAPGAGPSMSTPRAAPAAAPAAPPVAPRDAAGIAIADAAGFSTQPAVIWRVVTAEQAGRQLGRAILIHPGFPLQRVEMPSEGQLPVVRVVHVLPGGGNLIITQSRLVGGQPSLPTTPGSASLIRDDLVVTGTGPISADSIARLLEGLR